MTNQKTEQLSAAGVKSAPAGRHIDRHGLMLVVQRSGSRSWIQRIHIQGKRVDIGLGGYPLVKLAEARDAPTRTGSATGEPGRDSGIPGTGIPSGRIRADVEPVGEPNDAGSFGAGRFRGFRENRPVPRVASAFVYSTGRVNVMKRIIRKVATGCLFAGLVLAMPAWGQGYVRFNVDPNDPLRCEVSFISRHANTNDIHLYLARYSPGEPGSDHTGFHTYHSRSYGHATEPQTVSCGRLIWNKLHRATIRVGYWSLYHRTNFYTDTYTPRETETPTEPETPEPGTPTEPGTPGPTSQTCTYEHRLIRADSHK